MTTHRIGYIGLGSLGSAIFPNLVNYARDQNLPAPSVWNRSPEKYAPLKEVSSEIYMAEQPGELVSRCNVIFTCLVNDQAVEEVYGKLVRALQDKGDKGEKIVFADQTTLKVGTACKSIGPAMRLRWFSR